MTEFKTELEWMQRRADIEDNGFMLYNGKKYNLLYLDGLDQQVGFDAYIATSGEVLCARWQRQTWGGGRVIEEYASRDDMDQGIDTWIQWLLHERQALEEVIE